MRKIYFTIAALLFCSIQLIAQSSWLAPEEGYKTNELISDKAFSAFDVKDGVLYAVDEDGVYSYNLADENLIENYGTPEGYNNIWNSFLTLSPAGDKIWVGYTVLGVSDDRIYSIDVSTGNWTHEATMSANFDLEIYEEKLFVSGLNAGGWDGVNDINSIWLLDTSGNNKHKKIIEVGGNSTGFAIDAEGNIIVPVYDPINPETYIYRWSKNDVAQIVAAGDDEFLKIEDGEQLSSMPQNGPFDCEVDDANNLVFNCNDFANGSFIAVWNGNSGNANNYDVIASYGGSTFAWFGMIKAEGDINNGGKAYMTNFGDPLSSVQIIMPPKVTKPLGAVAEAEGTSKNIELNNHFNNSEDDIIYSVEAISNSDIADASIVNDELVISFLKVGQTNVYVKAEAHGKSTVEKLVVGVYPYSSGDNTKSELIISDFENLTLESETAWSGVVGELSTFESGLASFSNYKDEWSWSDWAYSNITDNVTAGFENQFSAVTGSGFLSANYGVGYISSDWETNEVIPLSVTIADNVAHDLNGVFITNSTYATLSMENGDEYSKKFGGESGNDPDYLKLLIWGENKGTKSDVIEFYLADYRFEDNRDDYIVVTWQWVDLSTLGKVDNLFFSIESSDVGESGINTPTYFNIDNLYVKDSSVHIEEEFDANLTVYPNPSNGVFRIQTDKVVDIAVYNLFGHKVYSKVGYVGNEEIDLGAQQSGQYIIQLSSGKTIVTQSIIIK